MFFDPQLDAQLRDVPLPEGLLDRLKASLAPSEEEIDAELAQVAVPAGMLARLREIPDEEPLDRRLRDVAVPLTLVHSARRTSWQKRVTRIARRAAELAAAAALFVAVSASLAVATISLVGSSYRDELIVGQPEFVVIANDPLQFQSPREAQVVLAPALPPVREYEPLAAAPPRRQETLTIETPDLDRPLPSGPIGTYFTALRSGMDPWDNAMLMRYGVLTYVQIGEERMPLIESPRMPMAAGIELAAVRGYDRDFFLKHRVFPPAQPAASERLSRVPLPLTTRTDSYREVLRLLSEGRRPTPGEVRTEDFLASIDYQLPPPRDGELGIRTAAGPSPFGPVGTGLVQIAAVAGALAERQASATHLVLAVDASATMSRGERLNTVREAADRVLSQVGPRDRVSLVLFQDNVIAEIERATADDVEQIRAAIGAVRPRGGTDLAEGLQRAVALALAVAPQPGERTCIALVTDSRVAMPEPARQTMTRLLAAAGAEGVRLDVLDLGDYPEPDEVLIAWAGMLKGEVHPIDSAEQAAWQLVELLYGRSPVVAADAQLTIDFRPQAVTAWRLIGHEANAMASLAPPPVSIDLRAGETATALVEVWLASNEENEIGTAELTWREPASGEVRRLAQRISRLQFAPTWEQAPLSLQQAAIAAETAEQLRGSRDALREVGLTPANSRQFRGIREAAASVHPRLAGRDDFRKWLELVEKLEQGGAP